MENTENIDIGDILKSLYIFGYLEEKKRENGTEEILRRKRP